MPKHNERMKYNLTVILMFWPNNLTFFSMKDMTSQSFDVDFG